MHSHVAVALARAPRPPDGLGVYQGSAQPRLGHSWASAEKLPFCPLPLIGTGLESAGRMHAVSLTWLGLEVGRGNALVDGHSPGTLS